MPFLWFFLCLIHNKSNTTQLFLQICQIPLGNCCNWINHLSMCFGCDAIWWISKVPFCCYIWFKIYDNGFLSHSQVIMLPYFSSYVEVYTETRTASLDEVFFPSLVVCNVNPMRKSFMYDVLKVWWLIQFQVVPVST